MKVKMNKKILLILGLLAITSNSVLAMQKPDSSLLVKGFQNLESIQKIDVINQLSAIADNDDVVFSKIWPKEYFKDKNVTSYIYLTKNDGNSLDIIKFDIPKNTENCMTKDNPEFCIPKVIPSIDTFIFDERLLYERTPNFITSPTQKEILEILLKDSKYFDTMKIKSLPSISKPPVSRKCDFVGNLMTKCQTFEKDSEVLISTEEVLFKTPVTELDENPMAKALKYVKYDSSGKKVEEYVYSTSKHTFFDENGKIISQEQINDSTFEYMNNDLFINVEFNKDSDGKILTELHYDRNHKLMRKYSAEYNSNGEISKIHVEDVPNFASWDIIPIRVTKTKEQAFSIRY